MLNAGAIAAGRPGNGTRYIYAEFRVVIVYCSHSGQNHHIYSHLLLRSRFPLFPLPLDNPSSLTVPVHCS